MTSHSAVKRLVPIVVALAVVVPATRAWPAAHEPPLDVVAVAVLGNGQVVLLATPGIPAGGRSWRFRSLDTSALPQPIRAVSLAANGTKIMIQPATGPVVIVDLSSVRVNGVAPHYVDPGDHAGSGRALTSHRLPGQRFVTISNGKARVIDDVGKLVPEYPVLKATHAAISRDGALLVVNAGRTASICGEAEDRRQCRQLSWRPEPGPFSIRATGSDPRGERPVTRFAVVGSHDLGASIVDPEQPGWTTRAGSRSAAELLARMRLESMALADEGVAGVVETLLGEAAEISGQKQHRISDLQFFYIRPDEELYAPVLEFAKHETVFPSAFETLDKLRNLGPSRGVEVIDDLYERYSRQSLAERRGQCRIYSRTKSTAGSWMIEYWFYYPFDVGGLGAHVHDPEHMFVEVDKLGGAVRRVLGAGHGYMAGNNIYNAAKPGAAPVSLPIFAMVELHKHATAPDIDRDGNFTPGLDENEYHERAYTWGVRDVVGTINNQLLPYDRGMTAPRWPSHVVAPSSVTTRFPHESDLAPSGHCQLLPIAAPMTFRPPCDDATTECAMRSVTSHPDFRDSRRILKQWVFPSSFLRATYGLGPRFTLNRVGVGWATDLRRLPGLTRMPLPGRVGVDVFYWSQDLETDVDRDACIDGCDRRTGFGWEARYERFFSNLFGIYSAVRSHSPPAGDVWIAFGPMLEIPLFDRSNVNLRTGLAFRPSSSPRFEISVSCGLWKPKTNHVGVRVQNGGRRQRS